MASYDEAILPGEVGKVTVQFNTARLLGGVHKALTVGTNDPVNPTVELDLRATVVGSALLLPAAHVILPSPTTFDYSGRLLVRKEPSETGTLKIADIETSVPWLAATAREIAQAEPATGSLPVSLLPGDWVLELRLADGAPVAGSDEKVTFSTGLPREPRMTVPVRVQLPRAMQARPASLSMRVPAGQREAQGVITVTVRPDLAKQDLKANVAPGPFVVSVRRAGELRFEATVVWKAGDAAEPQRRTNIVFGVGSETLPVPVSVSERFRRPAAAVSTIPEEVPDPPAVEPPPQ